MSDMTGASDVHVWHSLSFRDAGPMIEWLTAIGFTEHATYRDEQDPSVVHHAEWLWPHGGGIMFGSERDGGDAHTSVGTASAYLVTPEPDAVFDRAVASGGSVLRPMVDQDYGGRGGTVADPEGNTWSLGDYQPGA